MKKTIFHFKKLTINDMLISAFLLTLIIISKLSIFTINMGIMRVGITYPFLIVAGLILNFFLGIVTVILGDTLGLLINGTIGLWHYAYFIIPIGIFIITFIFKNLFKIKNYKLLILFNFIVFISLSIMIIFMIFTNYNFIKRSRDPYTNINFTDQTLRILVWTTFALMSLYSILITLFYAKYKTKKLKDYVVINIIVSFIFVIFIWYYGPIAQILWLSDTFSNKDYWEQFSVFQIPRVLKTPVMLPIYNFITTSIYKIYKQVVKQQVEKW